MTRYDQRNSDDCDVHLHQLLPSREAVLVSKARKDAKIADGVVLYSARHSFATDMLDRTGNIVLVGKMLGHRSVTTTQRYLHPEMKGMAELVNARNAMRAAEEKA